MDDHASYSLGEELASAVSHGLGFIAALIGTPFLVAAAMDKGLTAVAATCVFAGTVLVLYLTSTLYHSLPQSRAKRAFRILDHSAIFLLIAGTYTPFTLGIMRGAWGWALFAIVWAVALAGIALKSVGGFRYPRLSTALYIALGWIVVIALRPLWILMPVSGWLWLIAGGAAYTGGVVFYASRAAYAHFVWHLFVLAGTICHFLAVLWYSA